MQLDKSKYESPPTLPSSPLLTFSVKLEVRTLFHKEKLKDKNRLNSRQTQTYQTFFNLRQNQITFQAEYLRA